MIEWAARAHLESSPIIEGDSATFVWRGQPLPLLIGDFSGWDPYSPVPCRQVGANIFIHQVSNIVPNAYLEYAYITDISKAHKDAGRTRDPFNRNRVSDGISAHNHWFRMPCSFETPLTVVAPGVPRGTLSYHLIDTRGLVAGRQRVVALYSPYATYATTLPLVFDGLSYISSGRLVEIVDNLIYRKAVRPLAMALLDNGRLGRFNEYWCNEHAMEFVIDVVIPFAKRHLRLLDIDHCPDAYCIMGSSSGGLVALYTALRAPRIFGNVITQSGVFVEDWSDQFRGVWKNVLRQAAKRRKIASVFLNSGQPNRLFKLMAENKIPDVRIWMDVGIYDMFFHETRHVAQLVQENGKTVTVNRFPGGHNFVAWRDDIQNGLKDIFNP